MIDHVWTVLCWRSCVDKSRNSVSLLEVVEEIAVGHIPHETLSEGVLIPIELSLITLWTRSDPDSPCSGKGRTQLFTPSGEKTGEVDRDIDLQEHMRRRSILTQRGILIKGEGRYVFCVQLQEGERWKQVARIPLEVSFSSPE